ncbi:MAG TPA: hypothetical protein ENJ09_16360 [Planctomycetes bacterium]|nr:hypothetical protein [Planctomycetota bacterium]
MADPTRPEEQRPEAELDREIEIPDSPASPGEGDEEQAGYRGMLVPLVVVPAMIVMVVVLILVFFGMLSGSVKSPSENLARVLDGGANERTQAAFELVRQVLDYETAKGEGRAPEWDIGPSFLEELRNASHRLEGSPEGGDLWVPFVLGALMAQMGDADGVHRLLEMTRLSESQDPGHEFGQKAVFILGSVGDDLEENLREEVARRVIELTEGQDDELVFLAAAALQKLPSPGTEEALAGLLGAPELELRLQAALSLAMLGSDRGRDVLLDALDRAPYVKDREAHPGLWADQDISTTRRNALRALMALGEPLPADRVEALLQDDDPNLRSDALELSSQGGAPGEAAGSS